ncbi:hypothetical protein, partial [Salmonella sp. s39606]|uniref:hypothetical protein n=1 Tax=Salmonella sp. s39606 TaxID=3159643 RepID=UPI00397F6E43
QREVLRLLNKVHEPNRYKEQLELGNAYEPINSLPRYKNPAPVKQLVRLYRAGSLLPRGSIFTLFDDTHREQMILLFESLLFANDWETVLRTAAWARDRVNEGQFVYALSVAVLHREDTRGVVL